MSLIGSFKRTITIIRASRTIAISGHINPDGDSLGSLLSLGLALQKTGKTVFMISQDQVPKHYLLLPGVKKLKKTCSKQVDLAIAIDCGSEKLLGSSVNIFRKAGATLSIDHHEFRKDFTRYRLIDYRASSTSEIVYQLIKKMRIPLDKNIATNLLTALIVETNSFRLPSTNSQAFLICAELLQTG
ncbi:MAG: DHH family phosphoesterase, partial [Candidatus Aureabacteria bacterium]|nr:DHH family phosphoesterase [Candidatus Auribacterota bacterium]